MVTVWKINRGKNAGNKQGPRNTKVRDPRQDKRY